VVSLSLVMVPLNLAYFLIYLEVSTVGGFASLATAPLNLEKDEF
jgi:hypothetical protein